MVQVRLFAAAREAAGTPTVEVELPPNATVAELRHALLRQFPLLVPWQTYLLIAVDEKVASDAVPLAAGQEIACFPPVSGG